MIPRVFVCHLSLLRDLIVFAASIAISSRLTSSRHSATSEQQQQQQIIVDTSTATSTTTKKTHHHFEADAKLLESLQNGTSRDASERVCTVDDHNRPTLYGHDRRDVRLHNLWHRATYCIILHHDDSSNETTSVSLLVQRRSQTKDYCPGKLDPTPGGVVGFDESYDENALRELEEEMGIQPVLIQHSDESNKTNSNNSDSGTTCTIRTTMQGLFNFPYEDDRVRCWGRLYEVIYRGPLSDIRIQKEEVDEVLSIPFHQVNHLLQTKPHDWTPDSVYALRLYLQHTHDRRLMRQTSSSLSTERYRLRSKPRVIFFDCDDCLYFDNWKLANQITQKIDQWCTAKGLPTGEAYELYKRHGTALKGLLAEGYMDHCERTIDKFLLAVHNVQYHSLSRDEELRQMLMRLDPQVPKYIFTASARHHAERCLDKLGIRDMFCDIIDTKACGFVNTKYSSEAFEIAMRIAGVDDAESCLFLDDSVKNIQAGQRFGWRCVLVGRIGRDCGTPITTEGHAEHEIDRIHDFEKVFPELFV